MSIETFEPHSKEYRRIAFQRSAGRQNHGTKGTRRYRESDYIKPSESHDPDLNELSTQQLGARATAFLREHGFDSKGYPEPDIENIDPTSHEHIIPQTEIYTIPKIHVDSESLNDDTDDIAIDSDKPVSTGTADTRLAFQSLRNRGGGRPGSHSDPYYLYNGDYGDDEGISDTKRPIGSYLIR